MDSQYDATRLAKWWALYSYTEPMQIHFGSFDLNIFNGMTLLYTWISTPPIKAQFWSLNVSKNSNRWTVSDHKDQRAQPFQLIHVSEKIITYGYRLERNLANVLKECIYADRYEKTMQQIREREILIEENKERKTVRKRGFLPRPRIPS